MNEGQEIWGDVRTSPREFLEAAFLQSRERILKEMIQLRREIDSVNIHRFADNPISISLELDFAESWQRFNAQTKEVQNEYLSELFGDE